MTQPTWRERTFASLRLPLFRRYFIALCFSHAGFWMRIAASGWFVYDLTGSYEDLGIITAASLLPWVLVSPPAGVLADRMDQRRLMAHLFTLIALGNGLLGVGIHLGKVGWHELLITTIVLACIQGALMPARQAIIRRMIDVDSLGNAIGLNAAGFHVMQAVGFGLAGIVYDLAGPAACFYSVAFFNGIMAVQLHRLELPPQAPPSDLHPLRDLAVGFRYVWDHRLTRTLVLSAAAMVGLLLSFRALMPAIAKDRLLLGPLGYGLLMSLAGAGSFLGALWVASGAGGAHVRVRNMFVLVWIGSAAVLTVAWTPAVWLSAVAVLTAGFSHVGFMASANTTVQEAVPDHLRGRVMGIWALMFGAAYPLGTLAMGWGAEWAGSPWAITVGAASALVLSLVLFATAGRALAIAVGDELRQPDQQLG